jgi:hypothetical protein
MSGTNKADLTKRLTKEDPMLAVLAIAFRQPWVPFSRRVTPQRSDDLGHGEFVLKLTN